MTSSVGDEVRTVTSEDYGFKKLGQATILPSYDEKLPFASLQNLDICNRKGLYIASSGGKVVIGGLQTLRDFIQNHKDTEISFHWEKDLEDVIAVKFLSGNAALIVCRSGLVYSVDCTDFKSFKEVCTFSRTLSQVDLFKANEVVVLSAEGELLFFDLKKSNYPTTLATDVVSFDSFRNQIYLLLSNNSIQVQQLAGDHIELQSTITIPPELVEEFQDQYQPLLINALSEDQFLVVYGEELPETAEDVMYDHKTYIVSHSKDESTFSESFDITPAFGSVLRYPTSYNLRIEGLISNKKAISILASACSSEVTVWDSEEVVQPSQDSERAVLPISKITDNDTNPVGMALDVSTSGIISEPCQGVDSVERLPLIYILNNEGNLQIVGLYHASAIKNRTFQVTGVAMPVSSSDAADARQDEEEAKKSELEELNLAAGRGKTSEQEGLVAANPESENDEMSTTGDNIETESSSFKGNIDTSSGSESKSAFDAPSFGSLSLEKTDNKPAFGTPTFRNASTKSAFGTATFGTPAFGNENKPAFGTSAIETESKLAFGAPSFGTESKPAFGAPSFGTESKPAFGAPSFGTESKPAFGEPSFGTEKKSAFGAPSFGSATSKPAFGSPALASTPFGTEKKTASGAPTFGSPAFGSPAFGSTATASASEVGSKPAFGSSAFGSAPPGSENKPAFGTPSFGETSTKPAFGSPAFGSPSSKDSESKPAFGTVSFGSSSKTSFGGGLSATSSSLKTSKTAFSAAPFGKFAGQNPFISSGSLQSPLAGLASKADNPSPLQFDTSMKIPANTSYHRDNERSVTTGETEEGADSSESQESTTESDGTGDVEKEESSEAEDFSLEDDASLAEGDQTEYDFNRAEAESLADKKGGLETELSDSTIERCSSSQLHMTDRKEENKSTIASITARIKEGSKISTDDLRLAPPKDQIRSHSAAPFAEFAGDLKKASSPGFSFANLSGSHEKSEPEEGIRSAEVKISPAEVKSTEQAKVIEESPLSTSLVVGEGNAESEEVEKKYGKSSSESDTVSRASDSVSESSVAEDSDDAKNVAREDKGAASLDKKNPEEQNLAINVDPPISEENQSSELACSSREESYDALDDVLQEELEEAMKMENPGHEMVSSNASDKAVPIDENEMKIEYVSQGIQALELADCATQTDPPITSDFTLQSFEHDESYCALQNMPKAIPKYFTGANITAMKYSSQDSTMRSIEKTFQVMSCEIAVWQENAKNIGAFLVDQSLSYLDRRTVKSLADVYTWRISECSKLQNILLEQRDSFNKCVNEIEELHQRLSTSLKKAEKLEGDLGKVKGDYYFYETSNANPKFAELKHHQRDMQSELRRKMQNTAEKLNQIEEMLQILKLCTVESDQVGNNAYVHKLARDLADRDNLCNEITRLREQVNDLISKNCSGANEERVSKGCAMDTVEVKSLPVAELSLKLSTRAQIGSLLKKR